MEKSSESWRKGVFSAAQLASRAIATNWAAPSRKAAMSKAAGAASRWITASATEYSGEITTSIGRASVR